MKDLSSLFYNWIRYILGLFATASPDWIQERAYRPGTIFYSTDLHKPTYQPYGRRWNVFDACPDIYRPRINAELGKSEDRFCHYYLRELRRSNAQHEFIYELQQRGMPYFR